MLCICSAEPTIAPRYQFVDAICVANCDPAKVVVVDRAYLELEQAAAETTGAELLSVTDIVCPGDTCPVVVADGPDEYVVFRDNHHLTASYMEHLAEPIGRMLEGRPPYPPPSPSPAPDIAVS